MRTNKNTHSFRPVTQNSYKKSQRAYPEQKIVVQTGNSVERLRSEIMDEEAPVTIMTKRTHPIIINSKATGTKHYYFLCRDAYEIKGTHGNQRTIDKTCLWYLPLENPIFQLSKRSIQFISSQIVFSGWTQQQYPNLVYITMDGMMGYFDKNGKITDRVAVMELSQISPVYESANVKSVDLRYMLSSSKSIQWDIPVGISSINLRLKIDSDEEYVQLPLTSEMPLEFVLTNK